MLTTRIRMKLALDALCANFNKLFDLANQELFSEARKVHECS